MVVFAPPDNPWYFTRSHHVVPQRKVDVCEKCVYSLLSCRWYRDLDGVLQEVRLGMVLVRPLQSVLQFPRVQHEDGGRYVCLVSNLMGEDRREITLNVITPLTAHIRPQQQIVDAGTPAMFNCSVQGGSGGIHISWLKDTRPLLDSPYVSILQQGVVLLLRNVRKLDRGMYQCMARSNDESAQGSAELTLGGEENAQYFALHQSKHLLQ